MSLSDSDIGNIRRRSEDFSQRIVRQDFQGLASLYTEDAVLMPPGQPAVTGRPDIRKWMEAFPLVNRFDLHIDEADGYEDMAYVRGRFLMVLTPKGAPGPVENTGKYLEVRRRQGDGSWLIAVDIFNADV